MGWRASNTSDRQITKVDMVFFPYLLVVLKRGREDLFRSHLARGLIGHHVSEDESRRTSAFEWMCVTLAISV